MSSLDALPLKLAPKARQDFIDILRYTGETWGPEQLLVYRSKLDTALKDISMHPQAGRSRDELPQTHRAYLVGSHVIVYRIGADSVGVVRILHQRISLARHV
jgi:toxin ParE1/3/4